MTQAEMALLERVNSLAAAISGLTAAIKAGNRPGSALAAAVQVRQVPLGDLNVAGPATVQPALPVPPTNSSWVSFGEWLGTGLAARATIYVRAHTTSAAVFIQVVGSNSAPPSGDALSQFDLDDLVTLKPNDTVALHLPLDEAWHSYYGLRIAVPSGTTGEISAVGFLQEYV